MPAPCGQLCMQSQSSTPHSVFTKRVFAMRQATNCVFLVALYTSASSGSREQSIQCQPVHIQQATAIKPAQSGQTVLSEQATTHAACCCVQAAGCHAQATSAAQPLRRQGSAAPITPPAPRPLRPAAARSCAAGRQSTQTTSQSRPGNGPSARASTPPRRR